MSEDSLSKDSKTANSPAPCVLDIGNCGHDHGQIRNMLERNFGARTLAAHTADEAIEKISQGGFDLVLVNRKLDSDYSDGIEIIRRMKQDPKMSRVPVMLVTNFAEHQAAAVAEGALPGFGKLEVNAPGTLERLSKLFAHGND